MELDKSDASKLETFMGACEDIYAHECADDTSLDWTGWIQKWRDMKLILLRKKNEDTSTPSIGNSDGAGEECGIKTPSPKSKEYLLFRSSKPYRDAFERCSTTLDRLDRRLGVLCEELDVCLQAHKHAKQMQIKMRISVKVADAMHKVNAGTDDIEALHKSSRLATTWTDVLRELKSRTIDCEKACDEVKGSILEKEQEIQFLQHATPEQFMQYLRVRKIDDEEEDDDDDDEGVRSTVTRISDEAKSSVLEQVARIDRDESEEL